MEDSKDVKPVGLVATALQQSLSPKIGGAPYFRKPTIFQLYSEEGVSWGIDEIRVAVKSFFSEAESVKTSSVGLDLISFSVVLKGGERCVISAHLLLFSGTEVWSFAVYDDSPPSDFLAGLLALPKTVGAWRPYLLKCIPGAEEPEHSRPGTVRFRVNMELDTDLLVWVHFDEKSVSATFDADWLAATESGSWMQIAWKIDRLLEASNLFSGT
jgi:hypothetical protein